MGDALDWLRSPGHHRWLEAETSRLLRFAEASVDPRGGFSWLDAGGRPEGTPRALWIACRMTHVFALAHLLGRPGSAPLVDHGLRSLEGLFRDPEHGGWFASVDDEGAPLERTKEAYGHAFVVLAASSAAVAGRPGADELLSEAVQVLVERFWDDEAGMLVDAWDEAFSVCEEYRGLNSNMHGVEALLAAYDVLGDAGLLERALRITTRAYGYGRDLRWRLPEHFDVTWAPRLDYNVDEPAHPFRPFGATVGHGFEWARLGLQLDLTLGEAAPGFLRGDAVALFETAAREGWSVDGSAGFVYTVDFDGRPVVRQRMHWVAAEAVNAAAAVHRVTGDARHLALYRTWWDHIATDVLDQAGGSWWHELDPGLRPSGVTWPGKPDVYHAVQATLLPRLPSAPSLATALAGGLLG